MTVGRKLKDAHVCRVFISSPFNGMEGERETLTRLHWPQLQAFCSQQGVQLRLVDMRWGITSESGDEAQTINICLRELERSDIFIGFFGQRYGWAGKNDAALQRNFDMAAERYEWVDDYRDRSVTEIEFMAGHLNNPGQLPAAICFRDKSYDDDRLAEGQRLNNAKMLRSYAVESEESAKRMQDLKSRVLATKDEALGILMDYQTPEEGARFLYDCVWKYVTEELFGSASQTPLSPLEVQRGQHDAFVGSRSAIYVGGQSYMDTMESFLTDGSGNILLVTGEAGSGKSSLICQWLDRWRNQQPRDILIYHFIGCAAGTTSLDQILGRFTSELKHILQKHSEEETKEGKTPSKPDQRQLARDFQQLLRDLCKEPAGRKYVVVVDGLEKLDAGSKSGKALYWIPKALDGNNVKIILTTTTTDSTNMGVMEEYKRKTLSVVPLTCEEKASLCLAMLDDNSKQLSQEQLDMVLSSEKTNNPLHLKVIIDELCAFGYFRLLTKRIEDLVSAVSIEELLAKCIDRLETDYNSKSSKNVVEDILCALVLSRSGLSENEIMEMLEMSDLVWSPIYFALDKYLVKRKGLLGCAYAELEVAITKKYMPTQEEKSLHLNKMCDYFYQKYKEQKSNVGDRVLLELPYLLNTAGDPRMQEIICDLDVFAKIYELDGSELLVYWENIGWTDKEVKRYYSRSINVKLAADYLETWDQFPENVKPVSPKVFDVTNQLRQLLGEGNFNKAAIFFGERALDMLKYLTNYDEEAKRQWHGVVLHQRAACYSEMGLTENAMELHLQLVEERKREYEKKKDYESIMDLSNSFHSVGVVHMKANNLEEGLEYFEKALELFRSLDEADREKAILNEAKSLSNVALSYLWQGKLEESLKLYNQVLKTEEDYFFGELPLDIAYTLTNMGLAHRRLDDLDNAEKCYMKALEIKKNLLGHRSMDVGLSYINLSALENSRGNTEKALGYIRTAVDIYKSIDLPLSTREYQMSLENLAFGLFRTGRKEEAYEAYFYCLDVLIEHDNCEQLFDNLFREILRDMLEQEDWARMEKMLVAYIPTSKAAPDIYDILFKIDKVHLKKNHLDRPRHLTAVAGFQRFPESDVLWRANLELLMEAGDEDGILEHAGHFRRLAETDEKHKTLAQDLYAFGAKLMLDDTAAKSNRLETIYKALQEGYSFYPDNPDISKCMYMCLERMDRIPEAIPYLEKFLQAVPENPIVLSLCAKHRIMTVVDIDKAREYVDRLEQVANEDQSILDQVKTFREAIRHLEGSGSTTPIRNE